MRNELPVRVTLRGKHRLVSAANATAAGGDWVTVVGYSCVRSHPGGLGRRHGTSNPEPGFGAGQEAGDVGKDGAYDREREGGGKAVGAVRLCGRAPCCGFAFGQASESRAGAASPQAIRMSPRRRLGTWCTCAASR
jgi:hypothetical protein